MKKQDFYFELPQELIAQYPLEIAQIKKQLTDINSKKNQFPLVCELEKNS